MAAAPKITAPVTGEIIEITEVPDPVFAGKMMGEGFGVKNPASGAVLAPAAGEVTMTTETGHAFGLRTAEGLELLIHLGIDTVELEGKPFTVTARKGQTVAVGDSLGSMDVEAITASGKDTTVIVAITNSSTVLAELRVTTGHTEAAQDVAEARLKGVDYDDDTPAPDTASADAQAASTPAPEERGPKKGGLFGFLKR